MVLPRASRGNIIDANMKTLLCVLATTASIAMAQTPAAPSVSPWEPQTSPVAVELRGLSVVSDRVAWASGAKGTVLRTIDGSTWQALKVGGAESRDFRDIEAFDERTAIALSIGPGEASAVFKTTDGGAHWRRVFANKEPSGFWDAITFWDREHGALFGDPVRGRFQVFTTSDAGETWTPVPDSGMPMALENEGAFAASGSCIAAGAKNHLAFVTGGAAESRAFVSSDAGRTFRVSTVPVPAGAASKGLFSVAWVNDHTLITVGGDYKLPTLEGVKASLSHDGGERWEGVAASPGFLSSVVHRMVKGSVVVAVGLAGTGISGDGGRTWQALDSAPYNTVAFPVRGGSKPASGWAVGPKGVIARWRR